MTTYVAKGKITRAVAYVGTMLGVQGFMTRSVTTSIIASTTHTRAGATPLTTLINVIGTCANSGDAVGLPAATAANVGLEIDVYNAGANPAGVYPKGASDIIDGASAGASVTLTNANRARFVCTAVNTWISAQHGATSA